MLVNKKMASSQCEYWLLIDTFRLKCKKMHGRRLLELVAYDIRNP